MTTVLRIALLAVFANVAISARAVQFGWQQLKDGGIEYLVQVEPELFESFSQQGFTSDLPSTLRDVRRIHITVGREKLPNQNNLDGPSPSAAGPATDLRKSAPNSGDVATSAQGPDDSSRNTTTPLSQTGAADGLAKSAPAAEQTLPPMSFLNLRGGRGGAANPASANDGANESVANPQLKPGEGPHGTMADAANYHQVVDANKPNTGVATSPTGGVDAAIAKPWWALMGALLALFASLGANVYLVWIHQAVRAKYRALVQRFPLGGAAA